MCFFLALDNQAPFCRSKVFLTEILYVSTCLLICNPNLNSNMKKAVILDIKEH